MKRRRDPGFAAGGPRLVEWDGKLTPRALVEDCQVPGACGYCGGLGLVPEILDEDRWPVMVPCHQCQQYCKSCKKWVSKKSHSFGCPKGTEVNIGGRESA